MPRQGKQGFIWLPRTDPTFWKILINSVDVTRDIFSAEFTKAVCPETGQFKIELINCDSAYNNLFTHNQFVEFYIDFVDGTTLRFKGKIDTLKNIYQSDRGYVLNVEGGHLTRDLYDVIVTESFPGDTPLSSIFTLILAKYASTYTISNTSTYSENPVVNWDSKPFWDCISDLVKIANADCYVDDYLVIHFFDRNSVENNNEAVIWNDTLINCDGLGKQTITTKNKITVIGDDGSGLPVIAQQNNLSSQSLYGVKEAVLFDSKANNFDIANDIAYAQLNVGSDPVDEGDSEALILPSLSPGDKIWFTNPPVKIHSQYRVYSFTHKLPIERTTLTVNQERQLKQILKKRTDNELASQTITNPYLMIGSWNIFFDSLSELSSYESNIYISNGIIKLRSGTQGIFSCSTTLGNDITQIQLKVAANNVLANIYELSLDGGSTYSTILPEALTILSSTGKNLILRVTMQGATTEIDSIAVLFQ